MLLLTVNQQDFDNYLYTALKAELKYICSRKNNEGMR
jgi:hypothetical protein